MSTDKNASEDRERWLELLHSNPMGTLKKLYNKDPDFYETVYWSYWTLRKLGERAFWAEMSLAESIDSHNVEGITQTLNEWQKVRDWEDNDTSA